MREPIYLEGREMVISPSIGIAIGDEMLAIPEELLRRADVAMYVAKRTGKSRHVIFTAEMDDDVINRLDLESDLRKAIQTDQLRLHYQPIVRIDTGSLYGLEALVRWQHPRLGLIYPDAFISLAEETGLIVPLGEWVLKTACTDLAQWRMTYPEMAEVHLSINISPRQFQDVNLVERIRSQMAESGLDPGLIMLEITETVAMSDQVETEAMLRALKNLGVGLAIDDFGTGYSGLGYLQRCQIDTIKIDRTYIEGICANPGDEALVRAVAAYAGTLGVHVVAEGVETSDQVEKLRDVGVGAAQGYFYARPKPGEDVLGELLAGSCFNARRSTVQVG
jgi:EAL domain-containing protein (putative c-di-GMP-specific phosphodiesterase class I)